MVTVKGTNTVVEVNNTPTGGSVTTECCSQVTIVMIYYNYIGETLITPVTYEHTCNMRKKYFCNKEISTSII